MTKAKTARWSRTLKAAKAEQGSTWDMVLAIADDAFERDESYTNATAGATIEDLRLRLLREGIDLKFDVLKRRALTGVHVHQAIAKDRTVLTSVGWSIISQFAAKSYTPEASAQAIRDCRAEGGTPSYDWAEWYVRSSASPESSVRPRFTDRDAQKTISDLIAQRRAADAGEWEPSAMTKLMWQLLGEVLAGAKAEVDWDDELRALVDSEPGQ
jgi:hypothetical protein